MTTSLTRGRGRPRTNRPQHDTGTPETVMKRLLGVTAEMLDTCLHKGIINEKEHWCGIHLRWLYTIRHGVPGVRARDISDSNPRNMPMDEYHPEWRAEREREYHEAIEALNRGGHANLLLDICVYNERPKFLNFLYSPKNSDASKIAANTRKIKEGLDILVKLWKEP